MSKLELAKKKLELRKVGCAKEEMELRIMERQEEIKRLEDNIEIQATKMVSLEEEIKELN